MKFCLEFISAHVNNHSALTGFFYSLPTESIIHFTGIAIHIQRNPLFTSNGIRTGNPNLGSDAHSTGVALHALRETGFVSAADLAHRRGVQYLLSTQYPDGSWHVRSRAVPFQPYFQSGFPFEHDQWISAAATGWAAEALARSIETSAAGIREEHAKEQPEGR